MKMKQNLIALSVLFFILSTAFGGGEKTNVLFVNVNSSVDSQDLKDVADEIGKYLMVNTATSEIKALDVCKLVTSKNFCLNNFGKAAPVCVFIVSDSNSVQYLSSPLHWSVVNASNLNSGSPDKIRRAERVKRLAYRGVALACGCGATVDMACAMCYRGLCSGNPDQFGMGFAPGVYFPIQEILPKIGGEGILLQQPPEEE